MAARRRRRQLAPPPPRPTDPNDPHAPTTAEWRERERQQALARRIRTLALGLVLTLPFLAGAVVALPLALAFRPAAARSPWLRLVAPPLLVALGLGEAFGRSGAPHRAEPAAALLSLVSPTGALLWAALGCLPMLVWVQVAPGLELSGLSAVSPLPAWAPLPGAEHDAPGTALAFVLARVGEAVPGGLVFAGVLCGVSALEALGAKGLRSLAPDQVIARWQASLQRKGESWIVLQGIVLQGYISMLYAPEGAGKTELWLAAVANGMRGGKTFCGLRARRAKWYVITEQNDETLGVYLRRWGLEGAIAAGVLKIVTRDEAKALWQAHGYDTRPAWEHLAPIVFADAAAWGADVVLLDTWTFWVGGGASADAIDLALAPITDAIEASRLAVLILCHTNQQGDLLGNKELRRLCDVAVQMLLTPEGQDDPRRYLSWFKDRSDTKPGPFLGCARDIDAAPPCYRQVAVTRAELDAAREAAARGSAAAPKPERAARQARPAARSKGVTRPRQEDWRGRGRRPELRLVPSGGASATGGPGGEYQGTTDDRTDGRPDKTGQSGVVREALRNAPAEGVSTVDLERLTGLDRRRLSEHLGVLRGEGRARFVERKGKAYVWAWVRGEDGVDDGDGKEDGGRRGGAPGEADAADAGGES